MVHFGRAFVVSLSVIILVLISVLALELINENIAKSGFSSGEVFVVEGGEGVVFGEILGKKFVFDFSPVIGFIPVLEKFCLLLSPCSRLLIRVIALAF